ncbi:cytochrome b/b6 domain-containing protein [Nesterenkonia ebinurensis]|uniref:cytochrome b/b6 domain-containing protein n=1 Tax=Nesterenkonia ebinurensis TaxID=2608252 RepID=UPI001CC71454|nr:cytochrome b/b6 domain-containing protein [Nesterenkonia ebinurensis]
MTPEPTHRRRGLPRTEEEAAARAAGPQPAPAAPEISVPTEPEPVVTQSSGAKAGAGAPAQQSGAEPAPHRRRGLPRTEAEAAARTSQPQQAPAAPAPAEAVAQNTEAPGTGAPASTQQGPPAEAPQPPVVGLPPDKPGRRRGLPRTEAEAEARAAETDKSSAPPASEAKPARQAPAAGTKPARRTGLDSTPAPAPSEEPQPAPKDTTAPSPGLPKTPTPDTASVPSDLKTDTPQPRAERGLPAGGTSTEPARTIAGRTTRQWGVLAGTGAGGLVVLTTLLVAGAQWFLGTETGTSFLADYPGQYAQPDAPGGYPWWLNWAHFFNAFLMILIIKTGIQIRTETRPQAYWTPRWNTKRKISLTIWTHQVLDLLWVLNGVVFVTLLVTTGYWQRVVPTSWEIFPNAVSAGIQYASLDWPTHGEWAHYNSLQELAYFTTIFIAAPLAITTGIRMSGLWPTNNQTLNKAFPVETARAVHFPVMIYFTAFILIHVILVFATGALRNLNLIYTGQETTNWTGFFLFTLSLAVIIAAALATRAVLIAPIASLFGRISR